MFKMIRIFDILGILIIWMNPITYWCMPERKLWLIRSADFFKTLPLDISTHHSTTLPYLYTKDHQLRVLLIPSSYQQIGQVDYLSNLITINLCEIFICRNPNEPKHQKISPAAADRNIYMMLSVSHFMLIVMGLGIWDPISW